MSVLLDRQAKRLFGTNAAGVRERLAALAARLPVEDAEGHALVSGLSNLLSRVDESYAQNERDLALVRRSLELSSEELLEANERLREDVRNTEVVVHSLQSALASMAGGGDAGSEDLLDLAQRLAAASAAAETMRAALEKSEQRFELAIRGARDAVWDWDLATDEFYFSKQGWAMLGIERESGNLGSKALFELVHPNDRDRMRRSIARALEGDIDAVNYEFEMCHAGGHGVPVLSRGYILRDERGRPFRVAGTATDLTERKAHEAALAAAKDAAEAASRAKSEFLAHMSHELRTPLHAILGFSQLLAMDARNPEESRRRARDIENAGQHLMALLGDVMDLARIDSGQLDVVVEAIGLRPVIEDCLVMVQPAAAQRSIRIMAPCVASEGIVVMADPRRLRQGLLNLLSNAVKYNRVGGDVRLELAIEGSRLRLVVVDTGPGTPLEIQHPLFMPFDRLGAERGKVDGTGIGLLITRRLVEAMDGAVGFASIPGEGSRFWIDLPLVEARLDPGAAAPSPLPPARMVETVLHVDASVFGKRLMRQVVQRRALLQLAEVDSIDAARDWLLRHEADWLIIDLAELPRERSAFESLAAEAARRAIPMAWVVPGDVAAIDVPRGVLRLPRPLDVARLMQWLDSPRNGVVP